MARRTYNTGRVVGWSSYEEFIKETGIDPNVITSYIYQTLVTYGVTRVVELSYNGWVATHGGKFYTQTIRVKGASWGAVPIVGIDYEEYLEVFTKPRTTTTVTEETDEIEKLALEEAVGNIFGVYVSDANGKKATSSVADHGYLTFMAHPDILKFQEDVESLEDGTMKLIVRGLSMEDLDVDELYYGPQGFIFAGNGLISDCYHITQNINNLMLSASSYIEFHISGYTGTSGGSYEEFDDINVQDIGIVTGYIDLDRLDQEGYLMTDTEISDFLTRMDAVGAVVTRKAYEHIVDEGDTANYKYLVYGIQYQKYEDYPSAGTPMYVLCIRKSDGYSGFGSLLGTTRAALGYDAATPDNPPTRRLSLIYNTGLGTDQVLLLKDKNMPDYIGSYWGKDDGWNAWAGYLDQHNLLSVDWLELKSSYNAVFHDEGRNSYITLTPNDIHIPIYQGQIFKISGEVASGESGEAIRGIYICTSTCDDNDLTSTIQLSRRGGFLITDATPSAYTVPSTDYSRIIGWNLVKGTDNNGENYLKATDVPEDSCRIYQNEYIVVKEGTQRPSAYTTVNILTSNTPDLIVVVSQRIRLQNASSGLSNYTGTKILSDYTNAISCNSLANLLPTTITVHDNLHSESTQSYTITRGGNADKVTIGTFLALQHTVSDVFGEQSTILDTEAPRYVYQYIGRENNKDVLVSTTNQKGGTNLYTLSRVSSHIDHGFPRCKQEIPKNGSYYYNYPAAASGISVSRFFSDFGLDIEKYLHPDFRNTSLLKFLQNMLVYKHLGMPKQLSNKRNVGFSSNYYFFTKAAANSITVSRPTPLYPVTASMQLFAKTDPTNFTSPGFFQAKYINSELDPTPFNISNPDYPIWATMAKSRNGNETISVSMINDEGSFLNGSGSEGTIETDTITPQSLLVAYAQGKGVDNLAGARFKKTTTGIVYLVLPDDLRIYLTKTAPVATTADPIPDGALGLGWDGKNIKQYTSGSWS